MHNWLSPIHAVLDSSSQPLRYFFRDDDAGWSNHQLMSLLDVFAKAQIPIDLAVIPECLDESLSENLICRWQQDKGLIGFHQHGLSHCNHETAGSRKCEFGSSRSKEQQKTDIAAGQLLLREVLNDALDPIFTPPWNRCTQTTVECLEELDFKLLSRDSTAEKLNINKLKQVPVHLDWSKIIKTAPDPLLQLGQTIANLLMNHALTGIMLHHADMDAQNLPPLMELLSLFSAHSQAQGLLLRETIG